jgi:biotin operon repressor
MTPVESSVERLLSYIRKHPGQTFEFDRLTKSLKTDRASLDQAVKRLIELGYRLRVRVSRGITFIRATDQMTETEISYQLPTRLIGKQILAFRTVQSTTDIAATQAEHGASEGADDWVVPGFHRRAPEFICRLCSNQSFPPKTRLDCRF